MPRIPVQGHTAWSGLEAYFWDTFLIASLEVAGDGLS